MLMMHAPRGTGEFQVSDWAPQDLKAHIDFMARLNRELTGKGELVAAEGLASPGQARVVRAAKDGAPAVTDGPFPEAKEFLAGFWIVDVESKDRAYELASRISLAPGKGGVP
ncbi:MAG TPA: YciI family protein, partial [Gemmatimonadales bacterium]|nr:YciI family protein [Gemmatimonadales bacterium]